MLVKIKISYTISEEAHLPPPRIYLPLTAQFDQQCLLTHGREVRTAIEYTGLAHLPCFEPLTHVDEAEIRSHPAFVEAERMKVSMAGSCHAIIRVDADRLHSCPSPRQAAAATARQSKPKDSPEAQRHAELSGTTAYLLTAL